MKIIISGLFLFACFCLGMGWLLPTPPEHSEALPTWWGDPEEPLFHGGVPCVRDKGAPANGPIPKGYRLLDPHPTRTLPPQQPVISNP